MHFQYKVDILFLFVKYSDSVHIMKHHLNEDFMPHTTVAGLSLSDRFWNWANVAVEKLLREPPAPDYLRQEFLGMRKN